MALTDDILAYWKLEETSGDRVDSTPNGYILTPHLGTVDDTPGKIGTGLSTYDGLSDGNVRAGDSATLAAMALATLNGFTITGWYRMRDYGGPGQAGPNSTDGLGTTRWGIGFGTDLVALLNEWQFTFFGTDVMSFTDATVSSGVGGSLDTWYFIAAWWDADAGEIGISVNGGAAVTKPMSASFSEAGQFALGASESTTWSWLGDLDEIGVWTRTLSGAEITALYNAGAGLQYPFGESVVYTLDAIGAGFSSFGSDADLEVTNADAGEFVLTGYSAVLSFSGSVRARMIQCLDVLVDPTLEALPVDEGTNNIDLITDPSTNNNAAGYGERNPLYKGVRRLVRDGGSGSQPNRKQHFPFRALDDSASAEIGDVTPTQIDVLLNDTFTGQPNIRIISGPIGVGATAVVTGGGNESLIAYTPPASGGPGQDRLRYRLTANRSRGSQTATVRINVTRPDPVGPDGWPGTAPGSQFWYYKITNIYTYPPTNPGYRVWWDVVDSLTGARKFSGDLEGYPAVFITDHGSLSFPSNESLNGNHPAVYFRVPVGDGTYVLDVSYASAFNIPGTDPNFPLLCPLTGPI